MRRVLERYPIPDAAIWRTTVTPAALMSGDAHNRVPVDAQLKLDIRRIPDEAPEDVMHFVRECFPGAEVTVVHNGSALETEPEDDEVGRLAQSVEGELGGSAEFKGEHFGSDARFYSEQGIPAVCFGPHGAGLHSHEEWVDIASLEQFYRIMRRLVEHY